VRAQTRATDLIIAARDRLNDNDLDSAAALLRAALDTSTVPPPTLGEQARALAWRGVLEYFKGSDSLARLSLRAALHLNPDITFDGLKASAPNLAAIYADERHARGPDAVYADAEVHAQRTGGPVVHYPPGLARRRVEGPTLVAAVIDTFGRAEPVSIEVLDVPDTALTIPVRDMILASTFSPARDRGKAVRMLLRMQIVLHAPPAPDALALIRTARALLGAGRVDSAFALLREALDTGTEASEGERMYGLLVRGIASARVGRSARADADFAAAERLRGDLTRRGVPLAPFLLALDDSVQHAHNRRTQ
jgi:tetratricopeptide (TPR) repeat protein